MFGRPVAAGLVPEAMPTFRLRAPAVPVVIRLPVLACAAIW